MRAQWNHRIVTPSYVRNEPTGILGTAAGAIGSTVARRRQIDMMGKQRRETHQQQQQQQQRVVAPRRAIGHSLSDRQRAEVFRPHAHATRSCPFRPPPVDIYSAVYRPRQVNTVTAPPVDRYLRSKTPAAITGYTINAACGHNKQVGADQSRGCLTVLILFTLSVKSFEGFRRTCHAVHTYA